MRIALKECRFQRWGDTLLVVCDPSKQIELDDPDGHAEALLAALAAGPQTIPELRERLAESGLDVGIPELQAAVAALDSTRLLEAPDDPAPGSPALDERYHSNLAFFAHFATLDAPRAEFQRRLGRSHVLQLGTGGLGSNVLQSLAGLGVGRLTLLDHDVVEPRNFARQFLYRESHIGASKVRRAADWIRAFDSRIEVATVERRVEGPGDVAGLLDGVDLVVSGIDRPASVDQWVNEACVGARVPRRHAGHRARLLLRRPRPLPLPGVLEENDVRRGDEHSRRRGRGDPAEREPAPVQSRHRPGGRVPRVARGVRGAALPDPLRAALLRRGQDLRGGRRWLPAAREPWPEDPDCAVCRRARERLPVGAAGP